MLIKRFSILLKLYPGLVTFSPNPDIFDHRVEHPNITKTLVIDKNGRYPIRYRVDTKG